MTAYINKNQIMCGPFLENENRNVITIYFLEHTRSWSIN